MKKIDAILNGARESQKSMVTKLEVILTPFALLAVGKTPTYIGHVVRELGVQQCEDCGAFIFNIDGNNVAHVDVKKMGASVFGGEMFPISEEDTKSVTDILVALKKRKEEDDENPAKEILENMPEELKSLFEAAIMVSKLRKRGENN